MAPKQAEENHHMASSTEEEEESVSSIQVSESTLEDSKKDESSDDEGDVQSKPTHTSYVPVAAKKLEYDSEDESDSDSDSEPPQKTKSTLPESSTGKRSLEQTDDVEVKKKKMKTGDEDEEVKKISGDEAKLMFQRLFSEDDEIALLQGILDFTSTRGDFQKEMDAFVDYVKKLINFKANRSQLVTKIQRLKKKFSNIVKNSLRKGKSEEEIVFSKDLDQKAFELSRKIWGKNGVLASKSRMKVEESPNGFMLLPHSSRKNRETAEANANVVDTSLTSSRELSYFFKTENVSAYGLDEPAVIAGWDMVADGSKKREMEKKLKKLKAMQVELCMQRTGLVAESAKLIFKHNGSSSVKKVPHEDCTVKRQNSSPHGSAVCITMRDDTPLHATTRASIGSQRHCHDCAPCLGVAL